MIAHEVGAPRECIEEDAKLYGLKHLVSIDCKEVRRRVFRNQKEYLEMIEVGKIVYNIIGEGKINVEGLSKQDRQALETYRKQRPTMNYTDVALRP